MKKLDFSQFKHRIDIENLYLIPDAMGGHTKKWKQVGRIWAKTKMVKKLHTSTYHRPKHNISYAFECRYTPDISLSSRLKHKNKTFNILFIENIDEADKFLKITAKERIENDYDS